MSQPTAARSAKTASSSSRSSPRPSIRPVLVRSSGRRCLARREQLERALVAGAGPHALVEPRHGLGVVVEDVDRRIDDGVDAPIRSPLKSGTSTSTVHSGTRALIASAVRAKCPAPPSGRSSRSTEVTTTWRSPSRATASATRCGSSGSTASGRPCVTAQKRAVARADVAEQHERRRLVTPALADVRTVRLLADRVQPQLLHQALGLEERLAGRRSHLDPFGMPSRHRHARHSCTAAV